MQSCAYKTERFSTHFHSSKMISYDKRSLLEGCPAVLMFSTNALCVKERFLEEEIAKKFPDQNVFSTRVAIPGRNLATEETRGVPGTAVYMKSVGSYPRCNPGRDVVALITQLDYG